jgi:divalent metal cation (Fe/Co/Zn/Cd) transporter
MAEGGTAGLLTASAEVLPSGAPSDRSTLLWRGRRLEWFTVLWNSLEGLTAVILGALAGSISLVGFGVDSFVETSSGLVLLWRLQGGRDAPTEERIEARALRLVGASLFALAAYVAYEATQSLIGREPPEASIPGIVLACLSLVVMPVLAHKKRQVARSLGSRALEADAFQTSLCMYLSAILLVGLLLNAAAGLWWADPVAALAMVPIIAKEGWEAWQGEHCEDCGPSCGA